MARNTAITDHDDLNEYCLSKIFSYLLVDDMLQVRQVCSKWRQVSEHWFNKIQRLSFDENHFICGEWIFGKKLCQHKSRPGAKKERVIPSLNPYGPDMSYDMENLNLVDMHERTEERRKFIFQLVPKLFNNIVHFRIQLSLEHSPPNFNVMAMNWEKLKRLEIEHLSHSIGDDFLEILCNNKQLKVVSFKFKHDPDHFINDIFFNYLPTTIEEIKIGVIMESKNVSMRVMYLDCNDGFKYFISASKNFKSLCKLTFSFLNYLSDDVVKAIAEIKSLRHLTITNIVSYESHGTINPIAKLTDLKSLDLTNNRDLRGDDFINIMERCTKLEELKVIPKILTDKGIATIAKLKQLKIMIIYGRKVDCRPIIDICDNLEVFVCRDSNLENNDVIKLLRKATKLRFIDLSYSSRLTRKILDAAEEIANERMDNIICFVACEIDSSVENRNTRYFKCRTYGGSIPLEIFPSDIQNCLKELYGW